MEIVGHEFLIDGIGVLGAILRTKLAKAYDAIKAVLKVEKQKHELANELMMAIRRAARYEIITNHYKTFYIINEEEKSYLRKCM